MNELNNLLPETKSVIQSLAEDEYLANYTFVGGSALSVYLNHRLSEDFDLFTWERSIDFSKIQQIIEKRNFKNIRLVNMSDTQADYIIDGVKVTFFASGWQELKQRQNLFANLYIANIEILAVMKVNTLFLRAKFRDYYDLYILNKNGFDLPHLFDAGSTKIKNLSITLFQRAILFIEDIEDENIIHLRPIEKVSLKKISLHFAKQIKIWNKQIGKK